MATEPMTLIEKLRNPAWQSAEGPTGKLPATLNVEQTVATMNEAAERLEAHRKRPVAWRVREFSGAWMLFDDEEAANKAHEANGNPIQGLYVRNGT